MNLHADASLQLAWAMANTEASLADDTHIRPAHFFLGVLKLADPRFLSQLQGVQLPAEDQRALTALAKELRHYMEMSADEITRLRRSLRRQVRTGAREATEIHILHRSDESREVFRVAAQKAVSTGSQSLTALHLAEALFDTGHMDVGSGKHLQRQPSSKEARWAIIDDHAQAGAPRSADWFGRNLTSLALQDKLPPCEGREHELKAMLRVLARTTKRHIAIVGNPGVGKTTLGEGLAMALARGKTCEELRGTELLELHGSDIASDCESEAQLNRRLSRLFRLLARRTRAVLFLDDFHGLFPTHLKPDASLALLATVLSDGRTPCIAATSSEEWATLSKRSPSVARQFHVLRLSDPGPTECRRIAEAWAKRISGLQRVTFAPQAIGAVLKAANDLPNDRPIPDRIVDLLEGACTLVKVAALSSKSARSEVTPADISAVLADHYGLSNDDTPPRAGSS